MVFRSIPAVLLALLAFAGQATAQSPTPPTAAHSAAPTASPLTPDEARRALETLQDDAKRAQFIDTLRALANAKPQPSQSQAAQPTPAPAPAPAEKPAIVPVDSDGLGAQLLLQVSEQLGSISTQVAAAANTVTHFPLLWYWLQNSATNPATYDLLLDIAWKLALVLGAALAVEWLVQRAVRKPISMLDARIPNSARTTITPTLTQDEIASLPAEPAEAAVQTRQRRIKLTHAWQAPMRLPFVIGALVLELLPVIAFAAVGNMLLGTQIGEEATSRLVVLAIVNAYVLRRVIICIARTLVSSGQLSIFTIRGETAAYIEIWVRRIATVGVFGIALANVALLLGLYRPGYFALLRLVVLTVHLLIVVVILQCRRPVAQWIRADGRDGLMAAMRNRFAHFWHYIAIALVMGLWVVWALRIQNGYSLLFQYVVGTIAVILIARLMSIVLLGTIDRIFRVPEDIVERFPGIETRANRYLPMLRKIVSYIVTAIGIVALLEVWGIDAIYWFSAGQIGGRLLSAVVTIGIAALIAAAVWEVSNALLDQQLTRLTHDGHFARAARLRTFLPMLRTALLTVIIAVVALTALSEIGVNVAPCWQVPVSSASRSALDRKSWCRT